MVVDTVGQAQTCIEYLRKNNVGRATFTVLEKLRGNSGMGKFDTPENVPRLFDLIKPKDDAYAPAFFKAVHNTLVANDMEQANRIAFGAKRWRVVTLDGGLIETSGAMSGGGSAPQRGAMSSKLASNAVSPQVLQGYERDSENAAQQLQKASAELREAEVELDRLKARDPEIDLAYQKLGMDIENVKRRIAEAQKRVNDLRFVKYSLHRAIFNKYPTAPRTNPILEILLASPSSRRRYPHRRTALTRSKSDQVGLSRILRTSKRKSLTSVAQNSSHRNPRSTASGSTLL